jgi:hypothetical protein
MLPGLLAFLSATEPEPSHFFPTFAISTYHHGLRVGALVLLALAYGRVRGLEGRSTLIAEADADNAAGPGTGARDGPLTPLEAVFLIGLLAIVRSLSMYLVPYRLTTLIDTMWAVATVVLALGMSGLGREHRGRLAARGCPPAKPGSAPDDDFRAGQAPEHRRLFARWGAVGGGGLFAAFGVALWLDHRETMPIVPCVGTSSIVGTLLGALTGWAAGTTIVSRDSSRARLMLAWGWLGGCLAVLISVLYGLVAQVADGKLANLNFSGGGGAGPAPEGIRWYFEAVVMAAVVAAMFTPITFPIGAGMAAAIAWSRYATRQD